MRKRVLYSLCVAFLIAILVLACVHLRSVQKFRESLTGVLFYSSDSQKWQAYDMKQKKNIEVPLLDRIKIQKMEPTVDGNIWLLSREDEQDYSVQLWNQKEILSVSKIHFQPIDMCSYKDGVLLVKETSEQDFLRQTTNQVPILCGTADIIYLNCQNNTQSKLAECGFNKYPSTTYLSVQGEEFTFLPPDFSTNGSAVKCQTNHLCIYKSNGIHTVDLDKNGEIMGFISGYDRRLAIGKDTLFDLTSEGVLKELASVKGILSGLPSPDGSRIVYSKYTGMFADQIGVFVRSFPDGRETKLRIEGVDGDSFSFCWVN